MSSPGDEARDTQALLLEELAATQRDRDARAKERDTLQLSIDMARKELLRGPHPCSPLTHFKVMEALTGPHQTMCCEKHPEEAWPHDECPGPGVPLSGRVPLLVAQRAALERQIREERLQATDIARTLLDRVQELERERDGDA